MKPALCAAALALAAGCPRLPPPPPHPSVALGRLERAGDGRLRAQLRVHNHGSSTLTVSAVDWELVQETRPLLRGRSHARRALAPHQRAAIVVAIALPPSLASELGGRSLRLRGTVHLEDADGRGRPAPFDAAAVP
jgi:hypothetical protein